MLIKNKFCPHSHRESELFEILFLFSDLLPPSGLHVLRVEEKEVELRWDKSDATQNLISGFAIVFAPVGRVPRRTDFLEKQHSTYVLQGLNPGQLYNISAFSVKRNTNSNDISQPAFALIRTSKSFHCLHGDYVMSCCLSSRVLGFCFFFLKW